LGVGSWVERGLQKKYNKAKAGKMKIGGRVLVFVVEQIFLIRLSIVYRGGE
jgi:hypothetical protein